MPPTHPSVVAVLSGGLSLSLAACSGKDATREAGNPPIPAPDAQTDKASESGADRGEPSGRKPGVKPMPTTNPPPPPSPDEKKLPTWDEVESGHPKGATNPPRPVLVVLEDRSRCWKEWAGGMTRPSEEVMKYGGKVITDPSQTSGTEIRCDLRRVQNILDRKAAAEAPDEPK